MRLVEQCKLWNALLHLKSELRVPQEFGISGSAPDWSDQLVAALQYKQYVEGSPTRCLATDHWNASQQSAVAEQA